MVAAVAALKLDPPVIISAPGGRSKKWSGKSETANRPRRVTVDIDPATGRILDRQNFSDRHWIDRAVGYGIAAHEGQLFGWTNTVLGLLTGAGLILLSVSGAIMWWKRRDAGILGAPRILARPQLSAGLLGLLPQLLLIGGLAYLAVRLYRGWSAARAQPAGSAAYAYRDMADAPSAGSGPKLVGSSSLAAGSAALPLAIAAEDYRAFETTLVDLQAAYSKGDLAGMRSLATPEMVGYFSEQLSGNASRGVENHVEAVKLEQGDLSEAWSEAGLDYATVAMRFSMIDVTRRIADGAIVEGSDQARSEATEIWTFLRSRGGRWVVSAIQQA